MNFKGNAKSSRTLGLSPRVTLTLAKFSCLVLLSLCMYANISVKQKQKFRGGGNTDGMGGRRAGPVPIRGERLRAIQQGFR